jgi:hypothetical protein
MVIANLAHPSVSDEAELRKALDREHAKQYYQEHKARINARNKVYMRSWRKDNADKLKPRVHAEKKRHYEKHKDYVLARNRAYKLAHPEQTRQIAVAWKAKVKLEVLTHYSSHPPTCSWCKYSDVRALSIDHVNGGGKQHRATLNGYHIYSWLRKNGYPDGYQVLCMNCQFIKKAEDKEYGNYAQKKEEVVV